VAPATGLGRGSARIDRLVAMACEAAPDSRDTRPIAEIGYDLGQILLRVAERRPDLRVIGVEVQPEAARVTPVPAALRPRVDLRTGDGLAPLAPGECCGLILAGLGGRTIAEVLTRHAEVTRAVDFVLTCPSHLEAEVRPAFAALGMDIADERLVLDRGRYYECVLARPRASPAPRVLDADAPTDPLAAAWGPLLLGRPDPLMVDYLADQAHRFRDALATDLASYRAGHRAALGAKLGMLAAARARLARDTSAP
jgi:tRNA (adenine22-N1)-methyltransferase